MEKEGSESFEGAKWAWLFAAALEIEGQESSASRLVEKGTEPAYIIIEAGSKSIRGTQISALLITKFSLQVRMVEA